MNKIRLEKEDFLMHIREIKLWFFIRCYPEKIVGQELGKVELSESSRRPNKRDKGVCLVDTCQPLIQNIGKIFYIIKKLKEFLYLVEWLCFVVQEKLVDI